ncbi:MAG: hypothetical protein EOM91_22895 [Sphingobacteriia bacterium]|nr:hypothetical protein [Sphingobacteriia bacterium]
MNSVYLSPHSLQAAQHQRELDRIAARETARERFSTEAFETLQAIAEPLDDAMPGHLFQCRLEKILLEASDAIADQKIRQLEMQH